MRFWDSSAIVPLFMQEPRSSVVDALLLSDPEITIWWATRTECLSALARAVRDGTLRAREEAEARRRALAVIGDTAEIDCSEDVRNQADELLARYPLSAADALQLGASIAWTRHRPAGFEFVSLDARLRDAAGREGYTVLP